MYGYSHRTFIRQGQSYKGLSYPDVSIFGHMSGGYPMVAESAKDLWTFPTLRSLLRRLTGRVHTAPEDSSPEDSSPEDSWKS